MNSKKSYFLSPIIIQTLTTIFIAIYFVASLVGFYNFENSLIMRAAIIVIILASVGEYIILKRALGFLILTLFLSLFTLFNYTYSGKSSMWIIFLLVIPLIGSQIALWKKNNNYIWQKEDTLLWLLILIAIMENLIILNFINLSPYIMSFITLLIPITAIELYSDYRDNKLTFKRVTRIIIIMVIGISVILLSVPHDII